jgi:uroporphyrinogen III methyltransferase/synthase
VSGRVALVGAGPGDPELLTVRAAREIARADVLLYDALIEPAILELAPASCERIDVGKRGDGTRGISQDEISGVMIERARAGKTVVRLKGGDPFLFGRGGEEASALAAAGVPFEVVPGITSALAVPAYAGIPVTDRRAGSTLAIVTGHRGRKPEDLATDWEHLAATVDTLVILMGTRWLDDIVARVLAGGRDPATPAAVIAHGTTARQAVVRAPLAGLPAAVRAAELTPPTVVVIGEVARLRDSLAWFEKRPLFGRRVLLTRAEEQSGALVAKLASRGAAPVSVPLLAFEPPDDPAALAGAFARIADFDWLVLTSANALRFAPAAFAQGRARVACVGPATAEAARRAGLRVDVVPPERALPEELVAELRATADLADARVLVPVAAGAGDALARALDAAGARALRVPAYRTRAPADARSRLEKALALPVDAVLLASPSAVRHLVEFLGEARARELAERSVFAAIGPTTAAALRERGIEPAVVSPRQTSDDLVEALERHFAEASHGIP